MFYLFLITSKKERRQSIVVLDDKKAVFTSYPLSSYMNELLEVCRDRYHVKDRMVILKKTYPKASVESPFSIKKDAMDLHMNGWKPSFSDKEKKLRSVRISGPRNPNYGGMSDEHRRKLSEAAKGKPGTNTGKKFDKEWRTNLSQAARGNTAAKGMRWIHNPMTGEHKRLKTDEDRPVGWKYGMMRYK